MLTCGRDVATLEKALDGWKEQGYAVHGIVADVSDITGRQRLIKEVGARVLGAASPAPMVAAQ